MTGWEVFWIMKLGLLKALLCFAGLFCLGFSLMCVLPIKKEDGSEEEATPDDKKFAGRISLFAVFLILAALVVPSTKQMVMIKVIPMVTNSQLVHDIPEAAKKLVREYLEENK